MNKRQFLHRMHTLALGGLMAPHFLLACSSSDTFKMRPLSAGATVLALGVSLTWGTGADRDQAYPHLLAQQTRWDVINAGVPGNTSAQALERLPGLLQQHRPELVIVSIGGNDLLRRHSATETEANIRQICQMITSHGAQVVLVAIPAPALLAASVGSLKDHDMYARIARDMQLPLLSGAWASVLSDSALRSDQIHANARGYALFTNKMLEAMRRWKVLAA